MSRLLITGGTGSFGTAVLERFLGNSKFGEIVIFSRDEKKQHDMRQNFPSAKVKFVIGDTRDRDSVTKVMEGVDAVFHAAALKHVPTGEFFPLELVKTNILGTENVFSAAKQAKVKKVILLSTDKAVYPINTMGMTKAIAEKLMAVYSGDKHSTTIFSAVRYGNVMASRGSVIPLFVEQIKKGKDITITNPEMTRFMLSLDDALDLVELALLKAEAGNIFIKKAPAATIDTVAESLIGIFKSKSKIKIIGTRKGEKIHETLASSVELADSDDLGDFFKVRTVFGLDYEKYFTKGVTKKISEDFSSDKAPRLSVQEVTKMLLRLPYIQNELESRG